MQLKTLTHQTIALAGVAQAAALVHQLATQGTAEPGALATSIGSVLKIDADSVLDVFDGLGGLKLGLTHMQKQMAGKLGATPEEIRYAALLVHLQQKLAARDDLLNTIRIGIEKAQAQAGQFGLLHSNVLANLADIYSNTVSQLPPRIMVNGNSDYLGRADIADKVRACLLAGIRSVLLWRQCGGSRWKFLWYRNRIQDELQQLLAQLPA